MKRAKSSKSEKQYVKAMVHSLSLQRMTDQEIVDYLRDEKKLEIARTTVNGIRNRVEKDAEKWYIDLRDSRYKYIAVYKERLDSLFSYQKKLNQIIDAYLRPGDIVFTDNIIRAISELHRIEMSIFNLWKELPQLSSRIESSNANDKNPMKESAYYKLGVFVNECTCKEIISHCKCKYCLTIWCPRDKDKKQEWCPNPECASGVKGNRFAPYDDEGYKWVQCPA